MSYLATALATLKGAANAEMLQLLRANNEAISTQAE